MNKIQGNINNKENPKIVELGKLQTLHQGISGELKENLISSNAYKRAEFIKFNKKNPISIMDLQDIPNTASDNDILMLIASFLDGEYQNDKILNSNRSHQHLFMDQNTKAPKASRSMMEAFKGKTKTAIAKLKHKGFKESHFNKLGDFFPTDSDGNLEFYSFSDITNFIRKGNIKNSNENSYKKSKYIYVVCSILKEMIRNQDFKNNRDDVRNIQETTHQFFHEFIRPSFPHRAAINPNNIITDETDTNYTKDKFFILDDQIFKKFGINYENKTIPIKMEYRAKTDESIKDKNMINPDTTTLSSIHDLGGVKFKIIGEELSDKDLLVTYYVMFKLIVSYSTQTHPAIHKIAPSGEDAFIKGGLYESHPEIIESYLNSISTNGNFIDSKSPLMKDKGFLPIKKEKNGKHYIDQLILDSLNIQDSRFLYLLEDICHKKDIEYKRTKEKIEKEKGKEKKELFHQIFSSIKQNNTNIKDENEDKLWYLIQNYNKFEKIAKKIENNTEKAISGIIISKQGGEYFISLGEKGEFLDWEEIKNYKNLFVEQRKDEEKNNNLKKRNNSHKGNWPDAKISFVIYINNRPTNIEWQVCKEDDIKDMPLMDDHSIYGPAKQLLVYGRYSSGILTLQDIEHIIDNDIIKVRNKNLDYKLENGLTYKEMIETIEKDSSLLPKNGKFREKIIYNFTNERGLKKHGELYFTRYYDNLKAHGLAL